MTAPAQAPPAVIPPLETEAQALALPQVKAIYEAMRASHPPGSARLANQAMLDGALSAAGVKMGAYDHRILMWVSQYEAQVCAVIAGFIQRAAAGRGEQVAR